MSIILSIAILIIYALTHFVLDKRIDGFGEYASYIGEAILVVMTLVIFRKKWRFTPKTTRLPLAQAAMALVFGYAIYRVAPVVHIPIPFDFRQSRMLVLLLVLSPLIEEPLFRFALWCPIEELARGRSWVALLATTALFSLGHFQAYFVVPPELKSFVLYQTIYTFVVGLWWGFVYLRTRAIGATLALHFLFNLGFYVGFQSWLAGI